MRHADKQQQEGVEENTMQKATDMRANSDATLEEFPNITGTYLLVPAQGTLSANSDAIMVELKAISAGYG
jgi:hypothetical protein